MNPKITTKPPVPVHEQAGTPRTWSDLAGQRWGGASSSPGIDVPSDSWRWEVAQWPIDHWLSWRRRVDDLVEPDANIVQIRNVERQANDELSNQEGGNRDEQ